MLKNLLTQSHRYTPHVTYGLTAGVMAGVPGSGYVAPVLGAVGNAFDLPGSSVRDLLVGENPFDQYASPLSEENRVTGRDVLDRWGITAPNKETGIAGWLDDPMEGLRDLAGFGVEILTDPLNFGVVSKLAKMFRSGKAAAAHNAALEALQRNPERQRLGQQMTEAFGEAGDHTMTLLDAATIHNKRDPNLVYGGVTAKHLERAVAGVAAATAVAQQMMDSPLQQPAVSRPRLMGESDPRMLYQSPLVRTQWGNVKHVTDELEWRAGENPNFRKWDEGNVIRRHSDHYEHGVDSYAPYTVYHSTTNKDSYAPQGLGLSPEVKTHLMDKLSQLFSNDQDQIRYLSEHLQQTPSVAAEATDLSHMSNSELRQLRESIETEGPRRFINQGFLPVTTLGPVNKVETAEQLLSALALANPLTYINAQAPFSEFKTLNPVSREIGSHFGTYSQAASINPNKVPQPFYIRADNVVHIPEDLGSWNAYKIATALRRQNPNIPIPSHQGLELPFSAEETSKLTRQERDYLSTALSQGQSVENLRASIRMMRLLKLNKIDALRYPNEIEGPGYSYVVFDPTNIKSAHNYGSYDRNNPNFYMQSPIESQLPRGATQFTPEGTTLMAFEPDPSTAPHEMAHYMRRRFMPGNPWSRDREEAFAGGFENYLATTQTSSPAMSKAFEFFNNQIPKVYDPQMGYRNLPARGGYDYNELLGVSSTESPLDPKRVPDLATPAGLALARNLLARFSQNGGL